MQPKPRPTPSWWYRIGEYETGLPILQDTIGVYDFNQRIRFEEPTVLHFVLRCRGNYWTDIHHVQIVNRITDIATLNTCDKFGWTPLSYAFVTGAKDVILALLARAPAEVDLHPELSVEHRVDPNVEPKSLAWVFQLAKETFPNRSYKKAMPGVLEALEAAQGRLVVYQNGVCSVLRSQDYLPNVLREMICQYVIQPILRKNEMDLYP